MYNRSTRIEKIAKFKRKRKGSSNSDKFPEQFSFEINQM
jgi:hypothetical protein